MTQDIFRGATAKEVQDEKARRAVKAFRALQPGLTGYARALTRDKSVVVELATGTPRTDGKKIYFRPPIALGDMTPHKREFCDRRDRVTRQQLCDACRIREEVYIVLYHEIAHIAYGTFEGTDAADKGQVIQRAIEENGSKYAKQIEARINAAPAHVRNTYLGLASLISPFLPTIVNGLEDARVDNEMFKARRGTKTMFDAFVQKTFASGVEQDGGKLIKWCDYPLNSQAMVGVFVLACGYNFKGWFHPEVEAALGDQRLQELVGLIETTRSAQGAYRLAFPILARLRELGFCRLSDDPDDPQDEEQQSEEEPQEEPSEDQDQQDGDSGDDEGTGDTSSEPSEASDEEDSDGGESGSRDEESEEDSDSGPAEGEGASGSSDDEADSAEDGEVADQEDGTDGAEQDGSADGTGEVDGNDDSADSGDSPEGSSFSDGDSSEESDDSDSDGQPGSNSDAGDSDDAGSDGEPGADGRPGTGDMEGDGVDDDEERSSDRDPVSGESGDAEPSGPATDAEDDSDASDSSETDPAGSGGEGNPRGDSDPVDADAEQSDADSDGAGDDAHEMASEPESSTDADAEPVDELRDDASDEVIDTGADDGMGGETTDQKPEYGGADDVEDVVNIFGKHDVQVGHADEDTAEEHDAVDKAIVQSLYFETPSTNIKGIRIHKYGEPIMDGGQSISTAWRYNEEDWAGRDLKRLGVDCDTEVPESVLGPALLETRKIFAENEKANYQRHLKAGRINNRVLGKRAWANDPRLFQKKRMPGKRNYAVLIGVDISGSTLGINIALAKRAAMAQAELCNRLGVDFAVYAHTAQGSWTSWDHELNMDIYEIKSFDAPWSPKEREALAKIGSDSENLDGHTMEFYRKMIERRRATDKIILYYTDGKMPAANHDEELEVLQREIMYCKTHNISLLGVGIRTDSPRRHGLDTVQVDEDADLVKVIRHLEKQLIQHR